MLTTYQSHHAPSDAGRPFHHKQSRQQDLPPAPVVLRATREQQHRPGFFVDCLASLSQTNSVSGLRNWITGSFPQVFPHGVLCVTGRLAGSTLEVGTMIRHQFSEDACAQVFDPCTFALSGAMRKCLGSSGLSELPGPIDDSQHLTWSVGPRKDETVLVQCQLNQATDAVVLIAFSTMQREISREERAALGIVGAHLYAVMARSSYTVPGADANSAECPFEQLTKRECEVLHWMIQGKSNWSISVILGCGESTVKSHVKSIFSKLDVNSRVQAAQKWIDMQQPH